MNKTTVHHQNNDGTHFWPKKSLKVDQDHPTTFCQESLGLSCWIHQQAFVASQAVFDGFLSAHPSQWSLIGRDLWSLCVFRSAINSFWQNPKDSWITTADYSAFANVSLVRLETSKTNKPLQTVKWYHFKNTSLSHIYLLFKTTKWGHSHFTVHSKALCCFHQLLSKPPWGCCQGLSAS